jgi:hypothetical protein
MLHVLSHSIECEYPARKLGSVQADFEASLCEFLNDGPEGHAYAIIRNHSLREMRIFAFARKTYNTHPTYATFFYQVALYILINVLICSHQ